MEIEMKEVPKLEDGLHQGIIESVTFDHEPYEYTRISIKENKTGMILDYSCPTNLSENSKLMRLLSYFGTEFVAGKKINPESVLKNQKVKFLTISKPSKKDKTKVYSEIAEDSVKPTA